MKIIITLVLTENLPERGPFSYILFRRKKIPSDSKLRNEFQMLLVTFIKLIPSQKDAMMTIYVNLTKL